jgi:DNA-directed RNA polymerase sigma subunit (sigma70/sigma32)
MATLSPEPLKNIRKRRKSMERAIERLRVEREEFRLALIAAREDGHSLASIGEQFGVSAQRVDQLIRANGS